MTDWGPRDNLKRLRNHLSDPLATLPGPEQRSWLERFHKFLMERVGLVVIEVKSLADAFLLFETRARGTRCSTTSAPRSTSADSSVIVRPTVEAHLRLVDRAVSWKGGNTLLPERGHRRAPGLQGSLWRCDCSNGGWCCPPHDSHHWV
jgi:hypothetical protein